MSEPTIKIPARVALLAASYLQGIINEYPDHESTPTAISLQMELQGKLVAQLDAETINQVCVSASLQRSSRT